MPKITIDDKIYDVPEGKTVLQVCLEEGISVPYFCYHPRLSIAGNCRMCMVEIEGRPKLEISCNTVAQEGMVVKTKTPKVIDARKSVLEFILINHPLDCPICDQAGECDLQDQYFDFSAVPYRFREEKVHKPKAVPLGPLVMLDDERCIVCTRCVRFCDEVAHAHELGVAERGDHSTITTFQNEGMRNAYSVNTVDICPVGALTNRDFRFNKRVWFLTNSKSICTGCATGCNVWMDHEGGVTYRYRPRENEAVNQSWMCDEGRVSYKFINATDRVVSPHARSNDGWERIAWDAALTQITAALAKVPAAERGVVCSAQCSNEENAAWWWLAKEGWKTSHQFGTWRQPPNPTEDNILRHADKNPNTRCLQELKIHHLYNGTCRLLVVLDTLSATEIAHITKTRPEFVVVLATNWGTLDAGRRTQDAFAWADLVLPRATFAEQTGTFVNAQGRVQLAERAFAPKGEALAAWEIAQRIAGCENIAWPWATAEEIFRAIGELAPAFRGLTYATVGDQGVPLV